MHQKTNFCGFILPLLAIVLLLSGCMIMMPEESETEAIRFVTSPPVEPTAPPTAEPTIPPTVEPTAAPTEADEIDAAADAVLTSILWDGATTQEQVHAIYSWARTRISYGGHSDRTDWRQTAYTVLSEGKGDCFGFFAATKLLFERLGIPNIDVQKVKNDPEDSDHFWSLVSIDGGESYYHFDATPRWGEGDDFCLVTDAFLDDYSESHKGSHNRDKSLYPATPEDAP